VSEWVREVTDATFEREVLEQSKSVPVVVDFWAPWCGPCRVLGPLLERLAEEFQGEFVLAKVDVDENPAVASAFGIRSIPAVKAFRDGEIVAEFVGAAPESTVRAFLERVLPSEADRLAERGAEAEARGDLEEAERLYRQALASDVNHPRARLGLGRSLLGRDDAAALAELERVLEGTPERAEADRLAARLRLGRGGADGGEDLERRVASDPTDLEARLLLARQLAARQDYEGALRHFLEIVRRDRDYADQAARRGMLDIFEVLGPDHPLTQRFRDDLAKVLFS
jgi:putative thioredoxin